MFEEASHSPNGRAARRLALTPGEIARLPEDEEETWKACVLGLRDYVKKNRFPGVVLGFRAASTPPLWPPWRLMRWARTGSIA